MAKHVADVVGSTLLTVSIFILFVIVFISIAGCLFGVTVAIDLVHALQTPLPY